MSSFRILDPFQVYTNDDGTLAIGGSLTFYEAGTTTPEDVYADKDLTVNNGSSVAIGTNGKATKDIWGDATKSYRVRVYSVNNTLLDDVDYIGAVGAGGLVIPSLQTGEFLTNNGTSLLWSAIRQMLDPSGAAGKYLVSNGTAWTFENKPTDGDAGTNAAVTVSTGFASIGDGSTTQDLLAIQWGSETAPASGTPGTSKAVSFGTAFKAINYVGINVTGTGYNSVGFYATPQALNKTTTGFTGSFNVAAHQGGSNSDANITGNIPFDWFALGTIGP